MSDKSKIAAPALAIGEIVRYVFDSGQERPAMVVKLWTVPEMANLYVFLDGTNDGVAWEGHAGFVFRTSVRRSESPLELHFYRL